MKIAIIGATGKAGSLIMKEAINRGHEVTAIVRNSKKVMESKVKILEKDLFNLTYDDLKENDVIIDAFGAWSEKTIPLHQTSLKYLSNLLSGKENRILVVGGAGSLFIDSNHKTRVMDTPDFPEIYKPLAMSMASALDDLKKRNDVNWTYISPSANFVPNGKYTGKYRIGGEELLFNHNGESEISYADYAVAMIDEAENAQHIKNRFTVVSE